MSEKYIFTSDIGATNSRFALFSAREVSGCVTLALEYEKWLPGAEFPTFESALDELFHGENAFPAPKQGVDMAVLALAGAVHGETCKISNLPWTVSCAEAAALIGARDIVLINDFAAQGYYCLLPDMRSMDVLQQGVPDPSALSGVMGAGTSLGKGIIIPPDGGAEVPPGAAEGGCGGAEREVRSFSLKALREAGGFRVMPSEGGHTDFPFSGRDEEKFGQFIASATGLKRVISDVVVSGRGLGHLYAFITGERVPDKEAGAAAQSHPEVMELFARFYGRACRNFIVEILPLRGLYISGGIAQHLPVLKHPAFFSELRNSAAHSSLLRDVPVFHVKGHGSGLWGAAFRAAISFYNNS